MSKNTLVNFIIICISLCTGIVTGQQWSGANDQTSTISRTGTVNTGSINSSGSLSSTSNYGLIVSPINGDAIIKRGNTGNLLFSSGGGSSDIRFNYNYGGGSGGISVFDGGITNHANFSITSNGTLNILPSGGSVEILYATRKVGFNTIIPGVSAGGILSLSRPDDGTKIMFLGGAASPTDDHVIYGAGGSTEMRLVSGGGTSDGFGFYTNISTALAFGNNRPTPVMKILGNGNVGIGTTTPGSFKLAVNGKIWGTEVQVALNNPGPDYVFNSDYNLLSLEEIKTYIDKNKHLPEVPSAKEMEANGVQLGEMNMLLLKKIEELTLYMIRQDEQNKRQTEEINRLREMITTN
jgi:hypothetical protein